MTRAVDKPEPPEGTICSNTRCGRTKNLWVRPDGEWLCWPHYRLAAKKTGQYRGRKKHYEFAVRASRELHPLMMGSHDGGVEYPATLRLIHREFAGQALQELGIRFHDPRLEWLRRTAEWKDQL